MSLSDNQTVEEDVAKFKEKNDKNDQSSNTEKDEEENLDNQFKLPQFKEMKKKKADFKKAFNKFLSDMQSHLVNFMKKSEEGRLLAKTGYLDCFSEFGIVLEGSYEDSLKKFEKVVEKSDFIKLVKKLMICLNKVTSICEQQKKYKEGLFYSNKAIKYCEKYKEFAAFKIENLLSLAYESKAIIYRRTKLLNRALEFIKKAIEIKKKDRFTKQKDMIELELSGEDVDERTFERERPRIIEEDPFTKDYPNLLTLHDTQYVDYISVKLKYKEKDYEIDVNIKDSLSDFVIKFQKEINEKLDIRFSHNKSIVPLFIEQRFVWDIKYLTIYINGKEYRRKNVDASGI